MTYRNDEIGSNQALQRVLGALSGQGMHGLRLKPLSCGAVARLSASTAATSAGLYRLTAGNPFFPGRRAAARASWSKVGAVVELVEGAQIPSGATVRVVMSIAPHSASSSVKNWPDGNAHHPARSISSSSTGGWPNA